MKGIFTQKLSVIPREAAKLEKVVRNLKKTTFVRYGRKTEKSWDQNVLTGTCPGTVRLQ